MKVIRTLSATLVLVCCMSFLTFAQSARADILADGMCALKSDGKLICWSSGDSWDDTIFNQFKNSDESKRPKFPEVAGMTSPKISGIEMDTQTGLYCVLVSITGSYYGENPYRTRCWGSGYQNGEIAKKIDTVWMDSSRSYLLNIFVRSLSLQGGSACAVIGARSSSFDATKDGTLKCFGKMERSKVPTSDYKFKVVETAGSAACAIDETAKLTCWGSYISVPRDLGLVSSISLTNASVCAVTQVGTLRCWHYGDDNLEVTLPSYTQNPGSVVTVRQRDVRICVIDNLSSLRCFNRENSTDLFVPSDLGKVTEVSLGRVSLCAVKTNGKVRCWKWDKSDVNLPVELNYVSGFPKMFTSAPVPTITGTPLVGKKLSASSGDWGEEVTFKYQWLRNDKAIKGASNAYYSVTKADKGGKISVQITGNKDGFSPLTKTSKQIVIK